MGSPFDILKKKTYGIVRGVMGVAASWLPNGAVVGTAPFTATVLFSNPTETFQRYGGVYDADAAMMEYFVDSFLGLRESVENRGNAEIVVVDGREYMVRTVTKKHDGDTYLASIQLKIDE